jgi:hypothetical protein
VRDYVHPMIMRSSPGLGPIMIDLAVHFQLANCA